MYSTFDWWIDYLIWLMLQYKFMLPAQIIEYNDNMQEFLKYFGIDGLRMPNLCQS